jgi:PAS domain S-box-containing protein
MNDEGLPMFDHAAAVPVSILTRTLDAVDACVAILAGPDLRYTFVNRAYQAIRPGVTMLGMRFRDIFPEAADAGTEDILHQVMRTGETCRLQRYHAPISSDPNALWDGEFARAASGDDDTVSVVVFVRNVTQTVRVERALAASEDALRNTNQKLRETIDNITDGVLVMDKDWRYTFVSARAADMLGMKPEQLVGGVVWELFPDTEGTKFYHGYHQAVETGRPVHFEEYYPQPLDMWLECHCYPSADGLTVYFRDVSTQRRADEALRESTAMLRVISDTSEDIMFAKDVQGRMRFANPAALALIGKPIDQVIGRTDAEFLADAGLARAVMENDQSVMNAGVSNEFEEIVPLPDGQQKIWLSRKIPYLDDKGEVIGLLGVSRDITERKRKEHDLREESSRKDEFLAMLAHELRNPLAPITTGAQLLERFADDPARVRTTSRVIARQAKHMVALIDDLLDVSRVTRGLVELRKEDIAIDSVIAHAIEQARPLIESRQHQFHATLAGDDALVHGDKTRLIQVTSNILFNAAKYTPPGGRITLTVTVDPQRIGIAVSDSGIGIDAALLPKVFDLFTQSDRAPDRSQGGLGIGLSLVKSIVAMHGGDVRAESAGIGAGSTFSISLPRVFAAHAVDAPVGAPGPSTGVGAAAAAVMVVDDNEDAGEALAALLGMFGHKVTVAVDGTSALLAARDFPADVFILDIGLPDMDGFELATRLRAQPRFANAKLIALSGYGQPADRVRGREAGFDHYFVKPVNIEELSLVLGN